MRYVKTYELFSGLKKFFTIKPRPVPKTYNNIEDILEDESLSHLDRVNKIDTLCRLYGIYIYTLSHDYIIDCNRVDINNKELSNIPLKFGKVNNFSVKGNSLKSLKNSPVEVKYFDASDNQIESLEFCPKAERSIRLNGNNIDSLVGLPMACEFIDISNNNIKDISLATNLSITNTYFNVGGNNISELYPLSKSNGIFLSDNPIYSILLRIFTVNGYPDSNWVEGFNSYNIIYDDGIGKTKLFIDNLEYFHKGFLNSGLPRYFRDKLYEEDLYDITTMEEYFNRETNKDTDI